MTDEKALKKRAKEYFKSRMTLMQKVLLFFGFSTAAENIEIKKRLKALKK